MNARIANQWISWISWTRKLVALFKRTGSECYTGAIMTVPPELPPGTLRCSVFLVGIDRGEAAIPFSSDVVCDPRIHVSESDDEPRTFLVIPTRGQHCARYSLFTQGSALSTRLGNSRTFLETFATFATRMFLTRDIFQRIGNIFPFHHHVETKRCRREREL